jgi:hypothetical protein
MIDIAQPVSVTFIATTIGVIFLVIGIGILLVIRAKKRHTKSLQETV